jgi:hypothetical protein
MNTLYYDIETKPDQARVRATLKPFPDYNPFTCKLGNLTNLDKIAEKREKHKATWLEDKANQFPLALSKAALCPSTGSILCIQYAINDGPVEVLGGSELANLNDFWQVASDNIHRIVNWTGSNQSGNFDRNYLLRRSWFYSMRTPIIDEWRDAAADFLRHAPWGSYYSWEYAARELGIPVEDTGDVTGKTFVDHWIVNRAEAMKYAKQDVELVRSIWLRMRGGAA